MSTWRRLRRPDRCRSMATNKNHARGGDRTDRSHADAVVSVTGRWECVAARRKTCEQITPEEVHEPRKTPIYDEPERLFALRRHLRVGCRAAFGRTRRAGSGRRRRGRSLDKTDFWRGSSPGAVHLAVDTVDRHGGPSCRDLFRTLAGADVHAGEHDGEEGYDRRHQYGHWAAPPVRRADHHQDDWRGW